MAVRTLQNGLVEMTGMDRDKYVREHLGFSLRQSKRYIGDINRLETIDDLGREADYALCHPIVRPFYRFGDWVSDTFYGILSIIFPTPTPEEQQRRLQEMARNLED